MAHILMIYSTTDGHTLKICRRIKSLLAQQGHQVELVSIDQAAELDPQAYDRIVIGASIRYGKHNKKVTKFVQRNQRILQQKPTAFFSVNVVARKPDKNRPDTNPYLKKFLQQIPWQPDELAVFAGKIDYPKYGFVDRMMIRLIMYMTNGPTDPRSVTEFTDWQQVENFARVIADLSKKS